MMGQRAARENRGPNWLALVSGASLVARRRLRSDWRLQAAVAFGMVLASALMASGVVYSAVLQQSALRHTLRTSAPAAVNLRVEQFELLQQQNFEENNRVIEREIQEPLSPYYTEHSLYIQTTTFFFKGRPSWDSVGNNRPRGPVQSFSGIEQHVDVLQGRLPVPNAPQLEVAIESTVASALELNLGDTFAIYSAVQADQNLTVMATVVGIIQANDPDEEYWFGSRDKLSNTSSSWLWAPMFTTQDALFRHVTKQHATLRANFNWHFYLDKDHIRAAQAEQLSAMVRTAVAKVQSGIDGSATTTDLPSVLAHYQDRLLLGRLPLFLVIFLVTGTLMYYLFLVAGLLARERTTETALLKGRGATNVQIAFLALVEGAMIAVPAIVIGPVFALAMVFLTDRVAPIQLGASGLLESTFSWQAYLLGAAGVLLAVAMFVVASLMAARRTIVDVRQSQSRPPDTLFIQRNYMDVLALILVGLLLWQLRTQGSFVVKHVGDRALQLDVSLLLGPVLGLLGIGLIVLRTFPIATRLMARLIEPIGPIWLVQAARRLARNPTPAGLLVVLLLLATGLGVVGAAFSASLERSQQEQVLYQTGADLSVRHTGGMWALLERGPAAWLAQRPGVVSATDVVRTSGYSSATGFGSEATVLAIDPTQFAATAWTRSDFDSARLVGLLERPSGISANQGFVLPQGAQRLSIWASISRPNANVILIGRLRDAQGYYFDVLFGAMGEAGWRQLSAQVKPQDTPQRVGSPSIKYAAPYTVMAVALSSRGAWVPGGLYLDELAVETAMGERTVITNFQEVVNTQVLQDFSAPTRVAMEQNETVSRPGRRSMSITWGSGGNGIRGVQFGEGMGPINMVGTANFFAQNKFRIGETVTIHTLGSTVPVHVRGIISYFPTMYPDHEEFVVMDIKQLGQYAALHMPNLLQPNAETWVRIEPGAMDVAGLRRGVEQQGFWTYSTRDAASALKTRVADPLVTAGWSGLLALSFLTVVLASISGLLLYSYIDARERQTEFALMRTLGFTRRELSGVVWFNLLVVAGAGIGLGSVLGMQLGRWLLPLLEIAEGGRRLIPPMVLDMNWAILGITYAFLALAALITVVVLSWLLGKLELQRVLRMGET